MKVQVVLLAVLILGLGLCAGIVSAAPGTITVGSTGCDYTSIQEAIDQAAEGDVICLAGGIWEENLVIEKSLTLRGEGQERTKVIGLRRGHPVLLIRADAQISVRVEGLTLAEAKGRCADPNEGICPSGVVLLGEAHVAISDSTVSENRSHGIALYDSTQATISNTIVSDNLDAGISIEDCAQVDIADSIISTNEWNGIRMGDYAQLRIIGSTVSGNGDDGILLLDSAEATIEGNKIVDNESFGIALHLKRCGFEYGAETFAGYVSGQANTIEGNSKGAVCPPGLDLLMTEEGGKYPVELEYITVQPGESILGAIDRAAQGAVIELAEGIWEENLVIEKSLTLRGMGPEQTVIQGSERGYPVIWIKTPEQTADQILVKLKGLTITGAHGRCADWDKGVCPHGVLIQDEAQAEIVSSTIFGNADYGMRLQDSAQVKIIGSTISENESAGILLEGSAQAEITGSIISENSDGITIGNSAEARITDSTISENGYGVYLEDLARAEIIHSTISKNVAGIRLESSAQATITDSTISGNKGDGLWLWDTAQATIAGSTISENEGDGMGVGVSAWATISNCTISKNREYGLNVTGKAEITDSTISQNERNGIGSSYDTSLLQMTITHCNISGNGWSGIDLKGKATITDSTISRNEGDGIQLEASAQATIAGSTISENRDAGIFCFGRAVQTTIEGNMIVKNGYYGVRVYYEPAAFTGRVSGCCNTIPGSGEPDGNDRAAVWPPELEFLMTEEGGEYP